MAPDAPPVEPPSSAPPAAAEPASPRSRDDLPQNGAAQHLSRRIDSVSSASSAAPSVTPSDTTHLSSSSASPQPSTPVWETAPNLPASIHAQLLASPGRLPPPPPDPHNNAARAALTNEIRQEFFKLYEKSSIQIPGLSAQNILRHKDKDLHFEGHDGLRDFWKQTAATRREILQLARDNRIRVIRGPDGLQPQIVALTPNSATDPMLIDDAEAMADSANRKRTASSSADDSSSNGGSYKRISHHAPFTPDCSASGSTSGSIASSDSAAGSYRANKMVDAVQSAIDEYGGRQNNELLHHIKALERERDEALRVRDVALCLAEDTYRELRTLLESRGRKIRELREEGGVGD